MSDQCLECEVEALVIYSQYLEVKHVPMWKIITEEVPVRAYLSQPCANCEHRTIPEEKAQEVVVEPIHREIPEYYCANCERMNRKRRISRRAYLFSLDYYGEPLCGNCQDTYEHRKATENEHL